MSDDCIKQAQSKINEIPYITKNKKDYGDPEYESIIEQIRELVDIVADINGCTRQ